MWSGKPIQQSFRRENRRRNSVGWPIIKSREGRSGYENGSQVNAGAFYGSSGQRKGANAKALISHCGAGTGGFRGLADGLQRECPASPPAGRFLLLRRRAVGGRRPRLQRDPAARQQQRRGGADG